MIHMPSRSSQKYPKGLSLKARLQLLSFVLMQLLSLPSMALRLVENLQFCRSFGVATFEMVLPFASLVSATVKQGCGTDLALGFCRFWIIGSEQGLAANCLGVGTPLVVLFAN